MNKQERRRIIARLARNKRIQSTQRLHWATKRAEAEQEARDHTVETAGSPDYDLAELPDLVIG